MKGGDCPGEVAALPELCLQLCLITMQIWNISRISSKKPKLHLSYKNVKKLEKSFTRKCFGNYWSIINNEMKILGKLNII